MRTNPPRRKDPAAHAAAQDEPSPAADTPDDATLVAMSQEDLTQFVHLYRRYFDQIHRYCHRMLGDRAAAEDATSTTFFKALENIERCHEGAAFRAWLFRIAHNAVHDDFRSRRPAASLEAAYSIPDGDPSPEELAIRSDDGRRLHALLKEMKPVEREVIALGDRGLNDKEIAEVLGRSHGAIRNMRSSITKRLKARWFGSPGSEVGHADR